MARTKVQAELIATNAISGTIIADNAITATHIATNTISGTLVQNGGIVTTMIAANNITSTKIVTDAVLTRHIANDQVTGDKLTDNIDIAGTLDVTGATTLDSTLGIGVASPEGIFEIEDGGTGKSILQKITLDNDDVYGDDYADVEDDAGGW